MGAPDHPPEGRDVAPLERCGPGLNPNTLLDDMTDPPVERFGQFCDDIIEIRCRDILQSSDIRPFLTHEFERLYALLTSLAEGSRGEPPADAAVDDYDRETTRKGDGPMVESAAVEQQ